MKPSRRKRGIFARGSGMPKTASFPKPLIGAPSPAGRGSGLRRAEAAPAAQAGWGGETATELRDFPMHSNKKDEPKRVPENSCGDDPLLLIFSPLGFPIARLVLPIAFELNLAFDGIARDFAMVLGCHGVAIDLARHGERHFITLYLPVFDISILGLAATRRSGQGPSELLPLSLEFEGH